ncbi:MAG: CoA transferase [Deltaproteobacteria bacterium]|nr:MAG: CoA transferase [Deltaproteobacteria bacterium]
MTTSPAPLSPYRVLDLTDARAALGPMVLAGLGADVIKVEPPNGCDTRRAEPLVAGVPPALASLCLHAFDRGKRSVALDFDSPRGRADFLSLVASADFVIENAGPGAMDARGLGFAALREARPDLVYVAISPFGQDGPYAHHLATDLTLSAMGGMMSLLGEPDRRPVRITVPQTWYHAAVEGALAALVAHQRAQQSGEAQFVDVSVQAAVFWTGLNAMIAHTIQGRNIERNGTWLQLSTLVTPLVYPCADGEVTLIATTATLVPLIPWMVAAGVIDDAWAAQEDWRTYEARMLTGAELAIPLPALREKIEQFTRKLCKADLFEGGIAHGITLAPVNTASDVLALEHLALRDFWRPVQLADGRELRAAGPFARLSRTPVEFARPAPDLGEHTDEVLGRAGGAEGGSRHPGQRTTFPRHYGAAPRLPFEGVKFADFSWIGVGPITAKVFADHGATVVHVETDKPADRLRLVGPFKDGVAGINRCQFFGSFNTSKLSLQLDLKHPEGLAVAKRLLQWADICLDSFTAGTMAELGLGWDVARELNPGLIMASTCLMGQTGPAAKLAGYGYHAASVCGFYEVTGWDDRAPGGPFNAYTDTIAPRFLATTLIAALDHRRRTGEGQYIDHSQMESSLHFLGPELLEAQITGKNARRAGNEHPAAAPHDAYPCLGEDQWIAIAVESDEQWRALRRALGDPAWASASALDALPGRLAQRERIDRELAAFTAKHAPRALMDLLQAAGVPAGMVQRSSDHQEDPQLAHRQFFRPLEHPEMGLVPYEGHAYRISGYDHGARFPAPCLGEHTYQVLQEVLGLDDEEIARVMSSGACG